MATYINEQCYLTPQNTLKVLNEYDSIYDDANVDNKTISSRKCNAYTTREISNTVDDSLKIKTLDVSKRTICLLGVAICAAMLVLTTAAGCAAGYILHRTVFEDALSNLRPADTTTIMQNSNTDITESCVCSPGWFQHERFCYIFGRNTMEFNNASEFCIKVKASMVCPKSRSENDFLKSALQEYGRIGCAWLGIRLTDKWRCYDDRSELTIEDWGGAEPNGGLTETCAVLYDYFSFAWGDWPCNSEFYPLCRKVCTLSYQKKPTGEN